MIKGSRLWAGLAFLFLAASATFAADESKHSRGSSSPAARGRLAETFAKMPLSFESNQGQTDAQVQFLSRGKGYMLFLTRNEAVLALHNSAPSGSDRTGGAQNPKPQAASALRMEMVGANPASKATGLDELPGKSNYFIGNDPAKWRTNVPHYAKVEYKNVYPGIDLVYYGNQRQLEYDFVVAPRADPKAIQFTVAASSTAPWIDPSGDLLVGLAAGDVRFHRPVVYQIDALGRKHYIDGRYLLQTSKSEIKNPKSRVSFEVASYDASRPLVIDPVLSYSTYLGGTFQDEGYGIAADSAGDAYVTGQTCSSDFPTVNPVQAVNPGPCAAFVAKLNAAGSALIYSTYLGGEAFDRGSGIVADNTGNAYVTGFTTSTTFPTTAGVFQTCYVGEGDFVTKLDTNGALLFSTCLNWAIPGNAGTGHGPAIAIDSSGNAYVTGQAANSYFPTTAGAFQTTVVTCYSFRTPLSCGSAFVTKLNATGTALVYSTLLGGSGLATIFSQALGDIGLGIAVDSAGNAYVTGQAFSSDFPTKNALGSCYYAQPSTFVTEVNASGTGLVYSTCLGGGAIWSGSPFSSYFEAGDAGYGIALDSSGSAYVTGVTYTSGFPFQTTAGAFQTANGGTCYYPVNPTCADAFVTKIAPGGTLAYSTYLGGGDDDQANGIAVDAAGNAYVTGSTLSTNFPTMNAIQSTRHGYPDVFVTELDATGSALVYSTYLGGSGNNQGFGIALDPTGSAYITGQTTSNNFPTANPFQVSNNDCCSFGAFVAKISQNLPPVADASATPTLVVSPNNVSAAVTLNGSLSHDPDGDLLTYSWIVDGTPVGTGAALAVILSVGLHHVELDVNDGRGAITSTTITVTVITAAQAVNKLAAQVSAANIPSGIQSTLFGYLNAAAASFNRGNFKAGVNQLQQFIQAVSAQSGKKIDTATADALIAAAQAIINIVTG